jgi:hypothetical protein
MPNAITTGTVATAAAAGLVAMSIQNAPVDSGSELRKFVTLPTTIAGSESQQIKFDRLANEWRRNTAFSSSINDIVLDANYQQIIGMGVVALPLILNELKGAPEHWFWALAAITGANPAESEPDGDIQAAADAWVRWGKNRGIIR